MLADATRVPGNAAMASLVPRLKAVINDHLVELFADGIGPGESSDDGAHAGEAPPDITRPDPRRLPVPATDPPPEQATPRWDLLATCRLDPQRPPFGPYQRISDRTVSRTDPDACALLMRDGRSVLGYQTHELVDGGRARLILRALVTPGDVTETNVAVDQLHRVIFRRKIHPQRLIADAEYASATNIRALDDDGTRAYVPLPERDKSSELFGRAAFTDDAERHGYVCPQGEVLQVRWTDEPHAPWVYRARATPCNVGPVQAQCTPSAQGRLGATGLAGRRLRRADGARVLLSGQPPSLTHVADGDQCPTRCASSHWYGDFFTAPGCC